MEAQNNPDGRSDPEVSQPRMFCSYMGSAELPWAWATERLNRARNYWIATTRSDGRPHSRPVWGIWLNKATLVEQVVSLYNQKYNWNLDPHNVSDPFYAVRPKVAFGWHFDESELNPESSGLKTATRWHFK